MGQVQSGCTNPLNATDVEEGAVSDLRELQSIHDVVDANQGLNLQKPTKHRDSGHQRRAFRQGKRNPRVGWNPPQVGTAKGNSVGSRGGQTGPQMGAAF